MGYKLSYNGIPFRLLNFCRASHPFPEELKVIISASRRTDIPAFFSSWLMNRVRAGFCLVPNPFNPKQISRVSLAPNDVDAFVFWSKNPRPMLGHLAELTERGFPYYFQFTLNGYPSPLEPNVPPIEQRLDTFHNLVELLGPKRVVWRYDPILITPKTPYDFHAEAFELLAQSLQGSTQRVVVSVMDAYRKTSRRMAALADQGFAFEPDAVQNPKMRVLMSHISRVAKACGMEAFSCAETVDFTLEGVPPGSCIDSVLLASLGRTVSAVKDPGQRPACLCVTSRDIGVGDTCLHGCPYCYATRDNELAHERHQQHDPTSPMLFGNAEGDKANNDGQGKLF